MKPLCFALMACLLLLPTSLIEARTWKDKSEKYQVEAALIGYSGNKVILQRADHQLVSVAVSDLSEADRGYLKTEEAKLKADRLAGAAQTWTTREGVKVIGKVVDYVVKDVTVQRRRGKVYVNDRAFKNLPDVYRRIVPKIVAHFENNKVKDEKTLTSWLVHQKGKPHTYTCEGVVLEVLSGDEYALPFFLLSDADLSLLKPGWDEWSRNKGRQTAQDDHAFHLRSLAAAQQQDKKVDRQVAQLQLLMQAAEAGVTSIWEVTLYPGRGVSGRPQWVVVPGRDSRAAVNAALSKNPGYVAGPVRRINR